MAKSTMTTYGPRGESAYEIAVENGFSGTQQEWLDSLGYESLSLIDGGEADTVLFDVIDGGTA